MAFSNEWERLGGATPPGGNVSPILLGAPPEEYLALGYGNFPNLLKAPKKGKKKSKKKPQKKSKDAAKGVTAKRGAPTGETYAPWSGRPLGASARVEARRRAGYTKTGRSGHDREQSRMIRNQAYLNNLARFEHQYMQRNPDADPTKAKQWAEDRMRQRMAGTNSGKALDELIKATKGSYVDSYEPLGSGRTPIRSRRKSYTLSPEDQAFLDDMEARERRSIEDSLRARAGQATVTEEEEIRREIAEERKRMEAIRALGRSFPHVPRETLARRF